ncbi:MAG TPA: hypothetical protein VFM14_01255, partial [Gemmatimonadales bacterium]|nr:hypothetical protein [Gemmatimonadales bacterium]
ADAQRDARAALDAARALVAGDAPSSVVGSASLSLGHALRGQGAVDQARAAFATAAEQLRPTLGADHPRTREAERLAAGRQDSRR